MRRRLATLVAATTSLVLVAFLVPIALLLRSEAAERAISTATMEAQSLAPLVPNMTADSLPSDGRTTVFGPDGQVIGTPAERTASVRLAARGEAFVARTSGGREVLVPVQTAFGTSVVRVFVPDEVLYEGVARTWASLALLGLALFGVGMLIADRLGRRLVRSVTALAGTADRLARGDLTARVVPEGPPEVRDVGTELNRLAERIDELLVAARTETADLAHRLRTPLTALRLDAEGDPRLAESVQALTIEVDELIRTARRPVRTGAVPEADLAAVARDRLRFWSALAEDTGRPLSGEIPDHPVPVRIGAEDLAAAYDVLLDNAFRHTPDRTAVRLVATSDGTARVEDAGPGFDPDRSAESQPGTTGLGLDIARRTAEASGGSLRIARSPLGGATVELVMPPVGGPTA